MPAFMSATRDVERRELVDGLGLDGVGDEDRGAEARERVVEEVRDRVDLGGRVLAGDHEARGRRAP